MTGLKKKGRQYRAVTDENKLEERLHQCAIHDTFFIKAGKSKLSVALKGEVTGLWVKFNSIKKLGAEKVRIFWVGDQHVEFEGILNRSDKVEENCYEYSVRVIRMLLPEMTRVDRRYRIDNSVFILGKITYSSTNEDSNSIAKLPLYEELLQKMRQKLTVFPFVGVYSLNSSSAPSEIQFSQFTNSIMFIRNLSAYKSYLNKNEYFFDNNPRMRLHLENRLKTLNLRYSSLLVRPIDYLPMVGNQFPIAHIVAAKEEGEIQNEDVISIDECAQDLYNGLTKYLYRDVYCNGRLENISISGARIYIEESRYFDELSNVDSFTFVLRILGVADVNVSGEIRYIQKASRGFHLGVQFRRSAFGSRFPKFLFQTIQSHNLQME